MIAINRKSKPLCLFIFIFSLCSQAWNINANGSGILPFIKKNNQVFFLLSEDNHHPEEWIDFGGQGKATIENAAKEGHEETMGIFTGHYKKPYLQKYNAITLLKQKLNEKRCLRHLFSGGFEYATYLFNATEAVQHLNGMEKTINLFYITLTRLKKKKRYIYHCYSEKRSFRWVTKQELLKAIDTNKVIDGKKLFQPFRENLLIHREIIASL